MTFGFINDDQGATLTSYDVLPADVIIHADSDPMTGENDIALINITDDVDESGRFSRRTYDLEVFNS
jgi:hypothetical protein